MNPSIETHSSTIARTARSSTLKSALAATFLALSATAALADESDSSTCDPQFLNMRTEYPASARDFGAYGVVRVDVTLDANGRAKDAQVAQSSGHRVLDRAAVESIRKTWRFDVAQCSNEELATTRRVDVQYLPRIGKLASDPISRKVVQTTQGLLARNRCDITRDESDTIFSCVDDSSGEIDN